MAHSSRLGLMSLNEVSLLNRIVCWHIRRNWPDKIAIAATPMCGGLRNCIRIAKEASDAGADLISVIFTERYYSNEQIIEFFEAIANSASCGILVHEEQLNTIHGTAKMNWPLNLLKRVVSIPNVIAIKEDTKEDGYTEQVIHELHKDVAIVVSGGSKEQFLKFGPIGCQAYLVGIGSFDPSIAHSFYAHYLDGDFDRCKSIINNLERPFFEVSKSIGWHIGIKSAMEHMGIMSKSERRPLKEVTAAQHREIREVLKRLDYLK